MLKIGSATTTANASGEFTEGAPGAGVPATLIKASWLNVVQRELVNAIEGLGVVLDPGNDSQLLGALEKLAGETAEWAAIKNKPASFPPAAHAHLFSSLNQIPPALLALSRITSLSVNTALTAGQMGLVLVDANAAARTITLPASVEALGVTDVIVRRTDNSGNRLVVQAAGTDKIKFHTHLNSAGYPFFVLMGAGDYWHLRSDGAGNWWPISRFDNTPLGRAAPETTTAISPGGWGLHHGLIYNRADWPWTWDHAQASGMLTTEALRAGNEGKWTDGDGVSTFRTPEGRGEFSRFLDEGRGIDPSRIAGSSQKGSLSYSDYPAGGQGLMALAPTSIQTAQDYGLDAALMADWPAAWAVLSNALTPLQPAGGSSVMLGTARPRNIANPGRIKLI